MVSQCAGAHARYIELADGSRLGYAELGSPGGVPVVYIHGFPASRLEARLSEAAAQHRGIRLIAVDRPGYGLSDFHPGHRLDTWPQRVTQLADRLGIGRFAVVGVSGGGPFALACAWQLGERLSRVAVVAGLGPVYEPWAVAALRWHAQVGFLLANHARPLLRPIYGVFPYLPMRFSPVTFYALLRRCTPRPDRQFLSEPAIRTGLVASIRESMRQGVRGALHELVVFSEPWRIPFDAIRVPVDLWHGGTDQVVPPLHGEFFARAIPSACWHYLAPEGHFSILRHADRILSPLAARA
ncbi:MAG: alpha/beta fold hydrolase [Gammaproteobacteria bacterium]